MKTPAKKYTHFVGRTGEARMQSSITKNNT